MKPKKIDLAYDERIIAVVPERCFGPGWNNSPAWVYITDSSSRLRTECIQPQERTPEMNTLFAAGEAMCNALIGAVPARRAKQTDSAAIPDISILNSVMDREK